MRTRPASLLALKVHPALCAQPGVCQPGHLAEEVLDNVGIVFNQRGVQHTPPLRRQLLHRTLWGCALPSPLCHLLDCLRCCRWRHCCCCK